MRQPPLGWLIALAAVAGAGVAHLAWRSTPPPEAAPAPEPEPADPRDRTLAAIRAAWNPRARARALDEAARAFAGHEALLLRHLERLDHPWAAEVAELAAWMKLDGALSRLRRQSELGAPAARARAMVAAEEIEPWSTTTLAGLAKGGTPAAMAVLALLESRPDRPFDAVFQLLRHADATVRRAAARVLPPPSIEAAEEILRQESDIEVIAAVLEALARGAGSSEVETLLVAQLQLDAKPARRRAVLAAIAALPRPLAEPHRLWALAADESAARDERCLALLALERTKSSLPADGISVARDLPPVVALFAARCLLAAGARDAYLLICDLVAGEASLPADEQKAALLLHARQVLATVAGTRLDAGLEAWRTWHEGKTIPESFALPEPPLALLGER